MIIVTSYGHFAYFPHKCHYCGKWFWLTRYAIKGYGCKAHYDCAMD